MKKKSEKKSKRLLKILDAYYWEFVPSKYDLDTWIKETYDEIVEELREDSDE